MLLLLERLSPAERAAYVLHEAFNYPFKEIAEILHVEEANARQLATRARQHVTDGRRARVSDAEQKRLLDAFVAAAQSGDVAGLERLFAVSVIQANGMTCAIASRDGRAAMFLNIEASPEGIEQLLWVIRPSKLKGVAASSDAVTSGRGLRS